MRNILTATLVGMFLIGQLSRRAFDTRWLVGVGFAFLAAALWSMSHWTLGVGIDNARWPMIMSGFGSGLIFPAMSAATLACVSRERMGYASSLYNMMRNTGSAIGISLVTNLLNSREQMHQAYLTEHFTQFRAWQLDRAAPLMPGAPHFNFAQGMATHQLQGFGMMSADVQQQASLLAYNDIYRMLAMTAVCFIPAFLLLKKTRIKASVGH
jgi:DHA2 family multidrug resistance protein